MCFENRTRKAFFNISLQICPIHRVEERLPATGNACVSRTPATSKMEFFVILANDRKPLNNVTKGSILDVAGVPGKQKKD